MKPISCQATRDGYKLVHECVSCGTQRANVSAPDDSVDGLISVARDSVALLA